MKRLLCVAIAVLMLCGCTAAPAGTTAPETTVPETTSGPVLKSGFYIPVNEDLATMFMTIQLFDTGYGVMTVLGMPRNITWTPEGGDLYGMPLTPTADGLTAEGDMSLEFTYVGDSLPEGYIPEPPAPGIYAVSSVGQDGDVSFYSFPSKDNGYFELKEDGTGLLVFDGGEYPFTLEGTVARFEGWSLFMIDMSEQDTGGSPMVMVYVTEGPIEADSIAFRLLEDEA